jgi:DNA-binding XRE family transcriptional regulator
MGNGFDEFVKEIEAEARHEGLRAEAELAFFDERYRLAHELMRRRRQLKLTQARLAQRSGVGQAEISKIESGRSNPTLDTLSALAKALDCRLALVPAS